MPDIYGILLALECEGIEFEELKQQLPCAEQFNLLSTFTLEGFNLFWVVGHPLQKQRLVNQLLKLIYFDKGCVDCAQVFPASLLQLVGRMVSLLGKSLQIWQDFTMLQEGNHHHVDAE